MIIKGRTEEIGAGHWWVRFDEPYRVVGWWLCQDAGSCVEYYRDKASNVFKGLSDYARVNGNSNTVVITNDWVFIGNDHDDPEIFEDPPKPVIISRSAFTAILKYWADMSIAYQEGNAHNLPEFTHFEPPEIASLSPVATIREFHAMRELLDERKSRNG